MKIRHDPIKPYISRGNIDARDESKRERKSEKNKIQTYPNINVRKCREFACKRQNEAQKFVMLKMEKMKKKMMRAKE